MARLNVTIELGAKIFIDTAALVALTDDTDSLYESANALMTEYSKSKIRFYITNLILTEFLNALCSVKFRKAATNFTDTLRRSRYVTYIFVNEPLFDEAYELYRNRSDKDWSLTDCSSFVVMKTQHISLAFTSDKHFEQAGFIKLLEN